jgi:hypothetical protein
MAEDENRDISRKMFLKEVAGAGAAVCCACLAWSGCSERNSAQDGALGEDSAQDGKRQVHLAAACGTYCGACPAYLHKHGQGEQRVSSAPARDAIGSFVDMMGRLVCDGCLSGGTLAAHCRTCNIRLCAANKQKDFRCTDCKDLPCYRITNLINQGGYPHRKEYLPNLEKIRQMGAEKWVKYEEERWRCPKCGRAMSWYDAKCAGCGEARSERVFPLTRT